MISRTTLCSLLVLIAVSTGLWAWASSHQDNCDRYLAGDRKLPSSMIVVTGTRQIVVPCRDWIMRKPERIQIVCLFDLAVAVLFLFHVLFDVQRTLRARARKSTGPQP